MWRNIYIKIKKTRFHSLSVENANLEKVTTTVKIWSVTFSEISKFSVLVIGQNRNLETSGYFFFFLIHFITISFFCLNSFLLFLNLKLKQLSKFQVKEHFPRFLSFRFWVYGKIENSDTLEGFVFSSKCISSPFCLCSFLLFLNLKLH